ncbi:MAG TPA: UPF0175 family protein [Phycisphaerales bacterium]|nr:UPF0175 family protein [Phycisphaerales bacterium]
MTLSLNIPDDAKRTLIEVWGDNLDRAAFEALVIEGYRTRKSGNSTVQRLLGLPDRWATEKWLADRDVCHNYSLEDLEQDRETMRQLFGKHNGQ